MRDTRALFGARALLCAVVLYGCAPPGESPGEHLLQPEPTDPRQWTHERLMRGAALLAPRGTNDIRAVVLAGNHYQMGYQHGVLLRDAIQAFWDGLEADPLWRVAIALVHSRGPHATDEPGETYVEAAVRSSYDFIAEECAGLSDAMEGRVPAGDCTALASLMWMLEDFVPRHAPGIASQLACSQFVARGPATRDGKLVHGRNMDWLAIDAVLENPVILVRQPDDGLKHISVVWPGMVSTLTGINEAGLSVAIDENGCPPEHRDLQGAPPLQQITRILQQAHDVAEARALIEAADHAACQIFIAAHGPTREAALFEITATGVGVHDIAAEDVLYAANHFAFTDQVQHQTLGNAEDLDNSSVTRFLRLRERLTGVSLPPHPGLGPDAPDYAFGRIDVPLAIDLLRDPLDLRPASERRSFPCTEFEDGNWAVGNNHNLHSVVMVPEDRRIWIASGWDAECRNPIYNPYVGFDLDELFAGRVTPGRVPTYDPPYNGSYGSGVHADDDASAP